MFKRVVVLSALLTAPIVGEIASAEAQPYYRPYRPAYGRRAAWGFRHRPHLYIGGELMGYAVAAQVSDYSDGYLGHGGGGGLFIGGRLNPFFSIEGNWMITYHDETFEERDRTIIDLDAIYLMSLTVDGKIHIPTMGPLEPYFQAGIGYAFIGATYAVGSGDSVFANGAAFHLGGGLDYWLGPWFTLGGRILYRGLYFAEPNYDGGERFSNFVNGFSFDVNAAIHF